MIDLGRLVNDFAVGVERADARRPQAVGRDGRSYQVGIGPHTEVQTIKLVLAELVAADPVYTAYGLDVPYPESGRQRCDWCLGELGSWDWAIEAKMLRLFNDNGSLNDNLLMHVLSPYPAHRSALTDCEKLASTSLGQRKAVLIIAYDYEGWKMEPAVDAFESLAGRRVELGRRCSAAFGGLIHPVHTRGAVFAWEVGERHDV